MRPDALRPLCFLRCSTSWRCGALLVTPSKLLTDMNRRPGLVGLYFLVGTYSDTFKQAFYLLARAESHDCLLPVGALSEHPRLPARAASLLAAHVDGVHVDDGDLLVGKRLFERAPDLDLRRRRMAAEHVASRGHRCVRLLADHRQHQHLVEAAPGGHENASSMCSMASRVTITVSAPMMSRTERLPARMRRTLGMLRALFSSISLCEPSTTSTRRGESTPRMRSATARVRGASSSKPSSTRMPPSCALAESALRSASRRCLRGMSIR